MERPQDWFRSSSRLVTGSPGLVTMAVVVMSLGIGAPVAMFSIVHGFLRDLPFAHADRIEYLMLTDSATGERGLGLSRAAFATLAASQRSLDPLAGFVVDGFAVNEPGRADAHRYNGARVTRNALAALGVHAQLGTLFDPGATDASDLQDVVISDGLWRSRFGADSSVVGKTLLVDGRSLRIRGVMPPGFAFPFVEDLWLPLDMAASNPFWRHGARVKAFGVLAPGVSAERARADFEAGWQRISEQEPDSTRGVQSALVPYRESLIEPEDRGLFRAMIGIVSLVLLLACANVANLLLIRAASRRRSVALKLALGASRWTIVRELLAESGFIAAVGGLGGVLVAWGGIAAFNAATRHRIPAFWMSIRIDSSALLYALALVVIATIAAGVGPALQASAVESGEALKEGSRGATSLRLNRLTRALVVMELALSCALLVVSGLITKGVLRQTSGTLRFNAGQIVTGRLELTRDLYADSLRPGVVRRMVAALRARPGFTDAAAAQSLPGLPAQATTIAVEGQVYRRERDRPISAVNVVGDEFFSVMGLAALRGRLILPSDRRGAPAVAVVNETFARHLFGGGDPVGARIRVSGVGADSTWFTVVGLVPDLGTIARDPKRAETAYLSFAQFPPATFAVIARGHAAPRELLASMRAAIASVDPNVPVDHTNPLTAELSAARAPAKAFAGLFAAFGAASLLLATLGLYGVVSFGARQRRRELGIRSAIGATPFRLIELITRDAGVQLAAGLAVGLALAALIAPTLSAIAFALGVDPHDPQVYGLVGIALSIAAAAAAAGPAVRAARIDPAVTLREG